MEYNSPAAFHSWLDDVRAYILFINESGLFAQASSSSESARNGLPPARAWRHGVLTVAVADTQSTYNVPLTRVRVTIVAV
jgi:hypothetical protein